MGIATATTDITDGPKQLSDQNSQGTVLGASTTDLIGFYNSSAGGVSPSGKNVGVPQPGSQGSLTGQPGVVTVYASSLTPSAVAANTTAEQTFTITGLAVGQLVVVDKPTAQAGLSIVNARVSATNTLAITFGNDTAGSITPTAAETYTVAAMSAPLLFTAALTPAAVAANTTAEQQFSVPGLPAGVAVAVNKPTAQAGLGIVGARAVSAGVLGITFSNFTGAAITPTAAESYLVFGAGQMQVAPVQRTVSAALVPTAVAANTTAEQTFTVPGLNTGGVVSVSPPSAQAGIGIGNARISAQNTLAITFINDTAAAMTPPAGNYLINQYSAAAPAAGSSTAYNVQVGGSDHAALVTLGLVAGP